jgi:hypothetical protein
LGEKNPSGLTRYNSLPPNFLGLLLYLHHHPIRGIGIENPLLKHPNNSTQFEAYTDEPGKGNFTEEAP